MNDFENLIKFTSNGLEVADYPTILSKLVERYKSIYGQDINVVSTSADGIFLHNIALLINNCIQTIYSMYNNLDVNKATGNFLDNLCAISNVKRKGATKSTVEVVVTNTGDATVTLSSLTFLDKSGIEWEYNKSITLEPDTPTTIKIECSQFGEVMIPANWIDYVIFLDNNVSIDVSQENAGTMGSNIESDADLRARRNNYYSPFSVTTTSGLVSSLVQLTGVKDAYVFNNNTGADKELDDGYEVLNHNVYVVVRYDEDDNLNKMIGDTIYYKLTAGISSQGDETYTFANDSGEFKYIPEYPLASGSGDNLSYTQNIYWKKAIGVHPDITITLTKNAYWSDSTETILKEKLRDYLNGLPIKTDLIASDLSLKLLEFDPQFKGINTFSVASFTIDSNATYTNPLTFYEYTTSSITITYTA